MKRIYHRPEHTESPVTAQGDVYNNDTSTGPFNFTIVRKIKKATTDFGGSFSSRVDLKLMVATEMRMRGSLEDESAAVQAVKEALREAEQVGILAADIGVKLALFRHRSSFDRHGTS